MFKLKEKKLALLCLLIQPVLQLFIIPSCFENSASVSLYWSILWVTEIRSTDSPLSEDYSRVFKYSLFHWDQNEKIWLL